MELFFVLLCTDIRQRILIHSLSHTVAADVGVYLRGVELLVSENVLKHADVDLTRLIHQGRGGVTELVGGIVLGFKSRKL